MSKYHCYECTVSNGLIFPVDPDPLNLTGTVYQLDKYIKHTTPPTQKGLKYVDGNYIAPVSGVKVVYPEDHQQIHAFPITSISGLIYNCAICGKPLPQW